MQIGKFEKIKKRKFAFFFRGELVQSVLQEKEQKVRGRRTIGKRLVLAVGDSRLSRPSLLILYPLLPPKTKQYHQVIAPEHLSVFFRTALCLGEGVSFLVRSS
jgi:hypothetical protein